MRFLQFALFTLLCGQLSAQDVNVTFRVDMTGLTVSANGVHVAGDLNGWNTTGTPLTKEGNTNIYSATVALAPGRDIQYKYLNGNAWGTEEAPPLTCAVGGNNRIFTVPAAGGALDVVPFNGCAATAGTKAVTFRVDMSGQTVSGNGVHVAGNFNGWNPGSTQMAAIGGGVYEYTGQVQNTILTLQYKYINGNSWGNDEDPPNDCQYGTENNRFFDLIPVTAAVTLPAYTFGSCATISGTQQALQPVLFDLLPSVAAQSTSIRLQLSDNSPARIRIFDVAGREQFSTEVINPEQESNTLVNVADWANGVYMVQIQTSAGQITKRLMVQQ
jgi:Secretion system C-terminal sorting domain